MKCWGLSVGGIEWRWGGRAAGGSRSSRRCRCGTRRGAAGVGVRERGVGIAGWKWEWRWAAGCMGPLAMPLPLHAPHTPTRLRDQGAGHPSPALSAEPKLLVLLLPLLPTHPPSRTCAGAVLPRQRGAPHTLHHRSTAGDLGAGGARDGQLRGELSSCVFNVLGSWGTSV